MTWSLRNIPNQEALGLQQLPIFDDAPLAEYQVLGPTEASSSVLPTGATLMRLEGS